MVIFHHYIPFPGPYFLSILVNNSRRRQDHFRQCNKLSYDRLGLSMLVFIEFYNYIIEFYIYIKEGGGTLSLLVNRVHGGALQIPPLHSPLKTLLDLNILSLDLNVRLDDIGPETYFTIEKY